MSERVAVITGAADGIGLSCATTLVGEGAAVAMLDVNADRLAASADRLTAAGGRVLALTVDVRDEAAVAAAIERTERDLGPVSSVVSNVGVAPYGELLTLSKADWENVLEVNLTGTFVVTAAAARAMVAAGTGGAICCVASGAAFIARVGGGRYSTSKAGVVMLAKVLAMELGQYRIRVNAVAPGLINHGFREGLGHFVPDEYAERMRRATPLAHEPVSQDVADAVSYLLSERAAFVSGTVLTVDGASSVGRYDSPWSTPVAPDEVDAGADRGAAR